ncbi:cytochrome c oxidase assembly factor 1 homolog [Excalfactoria chinensis]|uniref:cytochrome c oxidase assembly factor 1 homolog n=1 Tax=Excalfactoria chinensis TaxID=46218 RepID=UPI003B3B7EE1
MQGGKMTASLRKLQQMAIFTGLFSSGGCVVMYNVVMQKSFARMQHYLQALEHLKNNPAALEALGASPLKVHNIQLTDRNNHVDTERTQLMLERLCHRVASPAHVKRDQRWAFQQVSSGLGARVPLQGNRVGYQLIWRRKSIALTRRTRNSKKGVFIL